MTSSIRSRISIQKLKNSLYKTEQSTLFFPLKDTTVGLLYVKDKRDSNS